MSAGSLVRICCYFWLCVCLHVFLFHSCQPEHCITISKMLTLVKLGFCVRMFNQEVVDYQYMTRYEYLQNRRDFYLRVLLPREEADILRAIRLQAKLVIAITFEKKAILVNSLPLVSFQFNILHKGVIKFCICKIIKLKNLNN